MRLPQKHGQWVVLALLGLVFLLSACARVVPPPENSQAGVVAVKLRLSFINPLGMEIEKQGYRLYFARLDGQGKIPSLAEWRVETWSGGDYLYLLNAAPGRWVLVGVGYEDPGVVVDTRTVGAFAEELVRASEVEVAPGKAAYMGSFHIQIAPEKTKLDPVQKYYLKAFLAKEAELTDTHVLDTLALDFKSGGAIVPIKLIKAEGDAAKDKVFSSLKTDFGPAWASRF